MRPEKEALVDELRGELSDAMFVIVTDYRGMNVQQAGDLRSRLAKVNAHFRVVKNRLFQRVATELSYAGIDAGLTGPSAMVIGRGDAVETAKILKDFIKENELPIIKIGALKGVVLSGEEVRKLADLPSRQTLLGQLVGTLAAPMTQVVGVLHQKVASLVYVLSAIEKKKND